MLGGGDQAQRLHAAQHQQLATPGTLGVDHGVGPDRVLRQAGQHGRFGQAQRRQRLAEVHLGRRAEAVRALPQVDLVHVQLEDLVLAQLALDLQRQQRLLDLALGRAPGRQEEGARHLLRDGGRTLGHAPRQIGQCGAQQAADADAEVITELRVLDGQHGLLQPRRHLRDGHEDAPLAAEGGNLHAVGREHLQVLARLVVGDLGQRRQVAPVPGGGGTECQCAQQGGACQQHQQGRQDQAARCTAVAPLPHGVSSYSVEPSPLSFTTRICG